MNDWGLIAVKRDWVPEWFWHFLCALTLNHVTPVHRWLCSKPPPADEAATQG